MSPAKINSKSKTQNNQTTLPAFAMCSLRTLAAEGFNLIFLSATLFATVCADITHAQVLIPYKFSINESGAANYDIPIAVPSGIADIAPKISLSYNSQSGAGLLGIGWGLTGFSSISRCPQTMAQDGFKGQVGFDLNDRYCLDGQRLISITAGDGAAPIEYRLEKDVFSKINSFSDANVVAGPGSFVLKTASGLVMEYGKTSDSRLEAQGKVDANGKFPIALWNLNKVSDAKGNFYTITYYKNIQLGYSVPREVNYIDAASVTSSALKVIYDTDQSGAFQARSDVDFGYVSGIFDAYPS